MGRYSDNIRRIAKTQELKDLISDAAGRIKILEKASIIGKRGIAYRTYDGSGVAVQVGTPGATNPDEYGDTPNQYGEYGFNGINGSGGLDDTTTDGDDLLSNAPDKGEDIGAIELKDCTTGENIDVRFNTAGNSGEAVFKHPTGRQPDGSSASIPSTINDWTSGTRWIYNSGGIGPSGGVGTGPWATAGQALRAALDQLDTHVDGTSTSYYDPYVQATCSTDGHGGTTSRWSIRVTDISISPGTVSTMSITSQSDDIFACAGSASTTTYTITFITESCTPVDAGCPVSAPTDEEFVAERALTAAWPTGTNHQLAFNAELGGFFSSRYDPNIPLKFRRPITNDSGVIGPVKGMGKLELCTQTDTPVVVEALRDGEIVYFEDDGFGSPDLTTNPIRIFDKDGKYKGTINEDEYESRSFA